MDKQPLNTGEQKDMTEFFTDLITKMEEMSQELVKNIIQITNFLSQINIAVQKNSTYQETQAEPAALQMFVCCRKIP